MRAHALLLAVLLAAAPLSAAERLAVKYRSAATVYLDGGRAAGLTLGDRLEVVEGDTVLAVLEVSFLAEQSASCKVVSETRPVKAGDAVRLLRRAPAPAASSAPAPAPAGAPAAVPAAPAPTVARKVNTKARGGISLGYYKSIDDTESGLDFEQRTVRADLTVSRIGGHPLSFTGRLRSRQDVRARLLSTRTPKDERIDRLYELALRYEPADEQLGLEVGRIGVSRFSGIGYLDGVLGRYKLTGSLHAGGFLGRRADTDGLGLEGSGNKYGGFLRLAPGGRYGSGEALLAYVRESAEGDVSREYLSLESRFRRGSKLTFFERAELDLNRGWREALSSSSTQLSNVSLSMGYRMSSSSSLTLAYDGRRSYRDFRNRSLSEELFDDVLHQGFRASLSHFGSSGLGVSVGGGVRLRDGDTETSYSGNASLSHSNLFGTGLLLGLDGSGFTNLGTKGFVANLRLGKRAKAGHFLDLSAGGTMYQVKLTQEDRRTQWIRLTGRAELGRGVSLNADAEYDSGDDLKGPRFFAELGYRF